MNAGAFQDEKTDVWYYQAVEYAKSAGIVIGYPDGTFKPNSRVTRADFVMVLSCCVTNFKNLRSQQSFMMYHMTPIIMMRYSGRFITVLRTVWMTIISSRTGTLHVKKQLR